MGEGKGGVNWMFPQSLPSAAFPRSLLVWVIHSPTQAFLVSSAAPRSACCGRKKLKNCTVFPRPNPSSLLVPTINLPEAFAKRPLVPDHCRPCDRPSDPPDPPPLPFAGLGVPSCSLCPVRFAALPWRASPNNLGHPSAPGAPSRPENPRGFLGDKRLRHRCPVRSL